MNAHAAALHRAGMSASEAEAKGQAFARLLEGSKAIGVPSNAKSYAYFIPGRIEVLGKHTDYAGGRSLLCCVERGFCFLAVERDDRTARFVDIGSASSAKLPLDGKSPVPTGDWRTYPATVARRIARNFPAVRRGADILFTSDLPPAAGLSSSSALIV